MQQELLRATASLAKSDPPPYFLSYSVYDDESAMMVASYGGLLRSLGGRRRSADVIMRVGAPALDNTHNENRGSGLTSGSLPLGDDRDAIARELWRLTNLEYRRAAPAFLNVKTSAAVRSAEEDLSPDFSTEPPQTATDNAALSFKFDEPLFRLFQKVPRGLFFRRLPASGQQQIPFRFQRGLENCYRRGHGPPGDPGGNARRRRHGAPPRGNVPSSFTGGFPR
jgi:hypothetical protein